MTSLVALTTALLWTISDSIHNAIERAQFAAMRPISQRVWAEFSAEHEACRTDAERAEVYGVYERNRILDKAFSPVYTVADPLRKLFKPRWARQ